ERDAAHDLTRREASEERREREDEADAQDGAALSLGQPGRLLGPLGELGGGHEPAPRRGPSPSARKTARMEASVQSRLWRRPRRTLSRQGWKWDRPPSSAVR